MSLPTTIPCPRCSKDATVYCRASEHTTAESSVIYVQAACECGVVVRAAGCSETSWADAESDALADLRRVWAKYKQRKGG